MNLSDLLKLVALVLLGGVAGFLNVTAGGGSLLTLPFLIFLGLPPAVANGTNRIAILVQNIFAVARFHQFKVIPKGMILIAAVPAVAGAILGAKVAVDIDELLFKKILAAVIVFAIALMFLRPPAIYSKIFSNHTPFTKLIIAVLFFGVGVYGGFIQAGIGFLLIAVLTAIGYDLVKTNALKVLIVLCFTPFALFVFIAHGQVDFFRGSVLAIGNAAGAWLGTRVVVEKGHNFIRWIVMVTALAFAVKLFLE